MSALNPIYNSVYIWVEVSFYISPGTLWSNADGVSKFKNMI